MLHRPTVGIIAAGLLITWVTLGIWPPAWEGVAALQGACLRIGLVMGAFWIALPQLRPLPGWLVTLAAVLAVLIAWQPKRLIFLAPLVIVLWFLRPRKKTTAKIRSGSRPTSEQDA